MEESVSFKKKEVYVSYREKDRTKNIGSHQRYPSASGDAPVVQMWNPRWFPSLVIGFTRFSKKPSDLTLTLDVEIWTCLRFLVAALLALFCKSYIASFSRYFTKFVVHPRYCQPAPLCLSLLRSKKQKLVLSPVLSMRELIKKHTVEGAIAA